MTENAPTPGLPEGTEQKYRMVDNPDGSGTKVREYYYVDADGNEINSTGEVIEHAESEVTDADAQQQADADARAAAIEADDAARQEWAEGGGDRIGDPPDPSVNASLDDVIAEGEAATAEDDDTEDDAPQPL